MKVTKKSSISLLAKISIMVMTKKMNITIKSPPLAAIKHPNKGISRGVPIIASNQPKLVNKL